jgi:hypothetical protein
MGLIFEGSLVGYPQVRHSGSVVHGEKIWITQTDYNIISLRVLSICTTFSLSKLILSQAIFSSSSVLNNLWLPHNLTLSVAAAAL